MNVDPAAGRVVRDGSASGGRALRLTGRGQRDLSRHRGRPLADRPARPRGALRRCRRGSSHSPAARVSTRVTRRGWTEVARRARPGRGRSRSPGQPASRARAAGARCGSTASTLEPDLGPAADDDLAVAAQRHARHVRRRPALRRRPVRDAPRASSPRCTPRAGGWSVTSARARSSTAARTPALPGGRRSASRSTAGRASAGSTCAGSTCSGRCSSAASTSAATRASTASRPTTSTATPTTAASRSRAADQLRFNRFLAAAAHARGLSIGLKNDLDQVRRARARLRLGAQRAVLPVRRVRPRCGRSSRRARRSSSPSTSRPAGFCAAARRRAAWRCSSASSSTRGAGHAGERRAPARRPASCGRASRAAPPPGPGRGRSGAPRRAARARNAAPARAPRASSSTVVSVPWRRCRAADAALARGDERLDDVADVDEVARLAAVAEHGRDAARRPPRRRTTRSRRPRRAGPGAGRRRWPAAATKADSPCSRARSSST